MEREQVVYRSSSLEEHLEDCTLAKERLEDRSKRSASRSPTGAACKGAPGGLRPCERITWGQRSEQVAYRSSSCEECLEVTRVSVLFICPTI